MPSEKPPLNEAQRYKRYRQLLKYKVECRLSNAENYCKKYDGSPCCYFCDEQWKDEIRDVRGRLRKRTLRLQSLCLRR